MGATRKKTVGNASELARLLGINASTVSRWKERTGFPPVDDDGTFVLADALEWHFRQRFEAEREAIDRDPMAANESTEGLERYRLARAQQEEIKLAELRGQVVKMSDFMSATQLIFAPWRRLAEQVKRMENAELWQMIEEANEQVLRGLDALSGEAEHF